jgi:hypothetical protein
MDLRETVKVLAEVHRLAHDRPTKDVLPIIHKITEPWHTHAALAGHPAETDDDYVVRFPRDALARPAPAEPPVAALRAAFIAGAKYEWTWGDDGMTDAEAEATRRYPDPPADPGEIAAVRNMESPKRWRCRGCGKVFGGYVRIEQGEWQHFVGDGKSTGDHWCGPVEEVEG